MGMAEEYVKAVHLRLANSSSCSRLSSSLSTHLNLQGGICMLVQLDEETWEVSDTDRLEEVLANLSDRAEAQGRLVTQLILLGINL